MLAESIAPTRSALVLALAVVTDACSLALLALILGPAMLTKHASATGLAIVLDLAVSAEGANPTPLLSTIHGCQCLDRFRG